MKKIILLAAMVLSVAQMSAQVVFAPRQSADNQNDELASRISPKVKYFVRAGVAASDFVHKDVQEVSSHWGYTVEAGAMIPFRSRLWGFQPSIKLIDKGARIPASGSGFSGKMDINQTTIEIPLNITGELPFTEDTSMRVAMGLYGAYGLSGNASLLGEKIGIYTNTIGMKRGDIGCDLEMSWRYYHLLVSLGMQAGFIGVFEKPEDYGLPSDINPHHRSFWLTAGYVF